MRIKEYDRKKAVDYATTWAMKRNPKYYNFDAVGGDCTSFASQSIYAGSGTMNYGKNGWYYRNGNDKSPSWSGVEYLHNFLVNNKSIGPFGEEVKIEQIEKGDIIQLSFDGNQYQHSLVVTDIIGNPNIYNILISTHTQDSYNRRLFTYNFRKIRFIKIKNVRVWN